MAKKLENIVDNLPDVVKNISEYVKTLKNDLSDNSKDYIDSSTGTIALIIKFLGKPFLDKYYSNKESDKLKNFGFNCYLIASIEQASKSIQIVKDDLDKNLSSETVFGLLQKTITNEINHFDKSKYYQVFNFQYHPIVLFTKGNYERVLKELNCDSEKVKKFTKDFNINIENTIKDTFGGSFEKHLNEIKTKKLLNSELELLYYHINLSKIGFKDDEDLKYEKTFAKWLKLEEYRRTEGEYGHFAIKEIDKQEKSLIPIEECIKEYFSNGNEHCLNKILFVVSDFGKGKSVFLKHYASQLAKKYLEKNEDYFPIYFNLRNFNKYSSENKLGVIANYIETEFGIKIDDDYFKKKKFFFLIDSLDESGDLTENSINKVINSVKNIQNIDKGNCRLNRILISTRPLDLGLEQNIKAHEPFSKTLKNGYEENYFLSIYGFKKEQFNDWMIDSIKRNGINNIYTTDFTLKILESIKNEEKLDIFSILLQENTLKQSELRRPIFAYMVYQLIINDIDFLSIGKIGVYLSFLNLLTKEAKHVNDKTFAFNLIDEVKYRNILHATAKLWMYQRQIGNQGFIKKSDICRVLDGRKIHEDDLRVLELYNIKSVKDIHFLSHSYFGENNNILNFQHQSFAEILLAEYYLKVFIKYALDNDNINDAEIRLSIGEPTEQTIQFLKELVKLLKESITGPINNLLIEKRKLLFPLLASLCVREHNKDLFCSSLYYKWFEEYDNKKHKEIPIKLLEDWCISLDSINKIEELAANIIQSNNIYIIGKVSEIDLLFNKELLKLDYIKKNQTSDIPKWISLLIGNELENTENLYFNKRITNIDCILQMIKNSNHNNETSAPFWALEYFQGLVFDGNNSKIYLNRCNFAGINFSNTTFINFISEHSDFSICNFSNCTFENFNISFSSIRNAHFKNIQLSKFIKFDLCIIDQGIFFPHQLSEFFYKENSKIKDKSIDFSGIYVNYGSKKSIIGDDYYMHSENTTKLIDNFSGFISIMKNKYSWSIEKIQELFEISQKPNEEVFNEHLIKTYNTL